MAEHKLLTNLLNKNNNQTQVFSETYKLWLTIFYWIMVIGALANKESTTEKRKDIEIKYPR